MANKFLAKFAEMTAVMVNPDSLMRFQAHLEGLAANYNDRELAAANDNADDGFWFPDGDWRAQLRPYVVKDGVLHIPVKGVLLHDFPYQFYSYATGYAYIERAMKRGMADGNVKGIALVIDSPGGEVAGNFALVDKIYAMRGIKPIRAFAAESAYSAAYSIASAADKIVVSRSGGVGSIGVVTSHVDISKMLDDIGYKITFIFAGQHKVDGNPYETLKPEVKERIQARIDELYTIFVQTVARNRDMEEQSVRDTEALTFSAAQATSNGLADDIGELDDSLTAFAVELEEGNEQMANAATNESMDVEKLKADARAEGKVEGLAEGKALGLKEGATAEHARWSGIFAHDAAKGKPKAAAKIAGNKAHLSIEDAADLLADMPEEKAEAGAGTTEAKNETAEGFVAAMNGQKPVDVGTAGEADPAATAKDERINRTLAHFDKKKDAA